MDKWEKTKIYSIAMILYTFVFAATTTYLGLLPPFAIVPVWVILGGGLIFLSEYMGLVEETFG